MSRRLLAAGLDDPVAAQRLGGLVTKTRGMMAKLQELEGMSGLPGMRGMPGIPGIPGSLNLPGLAGSFQLQRQNAPESLDSGGVRPLRQNAPGRQISQTDLQSLIDQTPDKTDTDGDGLPDAVEALLGTDPEKEDSDFDRLNDYYEVTNGLADYLEVTDVPSLDVDGDGIPNAWDPDNDNDGVPDAIDLSPFTNSTAQSHFEFSIKTNGKPTYVSFQLRPDNPEHIKLAMSTWDWPSDDKGSMQDRDNSTHDVRLVPMLELSSLSGREDAFRGLLPQQSEVEDYGIKIEKRDVEECTRYIYDGSCWSTRIKPQDKIYVPLSTVEEYGNKVAFNGRMFWPARSGTSDKIINYYGYSKGWALDVSGASSSAGAEVAIWPYEDADHFKWSLEAVADDYYKVTAKHSGKALQVDGGSRDQGANVDQRTYTGIDSQKWQFVPLENGYYMIMAKHSGLGLSVHQGLTHDGANVVQWRYRDTGNMQWRLESLGDGYYKIRAKHSGKELAVTCGSAAEGANVLQWTSQDTDNFKWRLEKVEPGPTISQWRWDTDGDGLNDKEEYDRRSNPQANDIDTDGDGLPDVLELQIGTDHNIADTDGDGLSDG